MASRGSLQRRQAQTGGTPSAGRSSPTFLAESGRTTTAGQLATSGRSAV